MPRLVLAVTTALLIAVAAAAQCPPWYPPYPVAPPAYPLTPAIWGTPFPKPLPPALPRAVPAVHEEDEPAVPAKPTDKKDASKGTGDAKDKDTPRIPKTRLPFPGDRPEVRDEVAEEREHGPDQGERGAEHDQDDEHRHGQDQTGLHLGRQVVGDAAVDAVNRQHDPLGPRLGERPPHPVREPPDFQ